MLDELLVGARLEGELVPEVEIVSDGEEELEDFDDVVEDVVLSAGDVDVLDVEDECLELEVDVRVEEV